MADVKGTQLIQALAPELLGELRSRSWVRLEDMELTGAPSIVTKRRVVAWLRSLGAEIDSSPQTGYMIVDKSWQIPAGYEVRVIERVVEKVVEKIVERVVERVVRVEVEKPGPTRIDEATPGQLVKALERKGYTVSLSKVLNSKTPKTDERPSLLRTGKERAA